MLEQVCMPIFAQTCYSIRGDYIMLMGEVSQRYLLIWDISVRLVATDVGITKDRLS